MNHFELLETFVDESHLSRDLLKCKECGQLYFAEFYEEIDWEDGVDPQFWTYIPVQTGVEIEMLKRASPPKLLEYLPQFGGREQNPQRRTGLTADGVGRADGARRWSDISEIAPRSDAPDHPSFSNIRFTRESEHRGLSSACPLSARSEHYGASIDGRYSPENGGGLTLLAPSSDTESDSRLQQ